MSRNNTHEDEGIIHDEHGLAWIPIGVAAKLIVSPRPGKGTHVNTVRKLIDNGTLEGRVRIIGNARRWYVRRDHVVALNELHKPDEV